MTHAREVVEQFLRAFYCGQTETARRYLCDNVSFTGPAVTFTSADDYLSMSAHVVSMVRNVEPQGIFIEDSDVCVLSKLETNALAQPTFVVDLHHLEGDRIATIHTIFDTGPFGTRAAQATTDSAVDPVCHMVIAKATQSITRAWGDTTYYFCSEGCAHAFEVDPSRYVAPGRAADPA